MDGPAESIRGASTEVPVDCCVLAAGACMENAGQKLSKLLNVSSLAAGMLPDGMSRVKEGKWKRWRIAVKIHIHAQRSIA